MPKRQPYERNPAETLVQGTVAVVLIVSITVLGITRVLDDHEVLAALLSGGSATAILTLADRFLYRRLPPS